ncbi:MAG: hypothetical protein LUC33_04735 [Prevotellaceae bacterium]|nr:hypothetical protein [Prevotellaceae bacterium]
MQTDPELFDNRRRYTFAEAVRLWGCSEGTLREIVRQRPYMLAQNKVLGKWQLRGLMLNRVYYGRDRLDEQGRPLRPAAMERVF